ncbi:MAG: hypothetical protein JWO06_1623, partial [Bacteroidota bacterium]|nr:hypothetical protein [Bacteroidota bacterium]
MLLTGAGVRYFGPAEILRGLSGKIHIFQQMKRPFLTLLFILPLWLFPQDSSKNIMQILEVTPGYYHAFAITKTPDTIMGDVTIGEMQSSVDV